MLRLTLRSLAVGLAALFFIPSADADILVGKKNGDLIECKLIKVITKKIPGQGGPKQYLVVNLEDGKQKEYLAKDYHVIRRKPSWEVRAEEKEWYKTKSVAVKDNWKKQESFAKQCNRKKYLDAEAIVHFQKAYELRKPELKDEIRDHEKMARILERDYGLFDESKEEWRWVYNKKKAEEDTRDVKFHMSMARWCMRTAGLYEEAIDEYNAALKLEPGNRSAEKGLAKLRKALEVPMNASLLRMVKPAFLTALKYLKAKQNKDGSFGSDFKEAGVHGHHGMTAISGLALLAEWEIMTLEDLDAASEAPKELKKCLEFVLTNKELGKGLRGPDVWGAIWRLEFLSRLIKKEAFRPMKDKIKARAIETLEEMKRYKRQDGGYAYYDFVQTGITFVSAVAIVAMTSAKKAGIPVEDSMITGAASSVMKCKQGTGQFSYRPGVQEAAVGCAGRSSLCEMAMILAGQNQGALATAVDNFFRYRHLLEAIKGQQGTHIGEGKTAPYYYIFGHYWTSRAIKFLPKAQQGVWLKKMAGFFLKNQERNGSFWDTPLTKDKDVYGTAFGAIVLYRIARERRTSR